MKFVKHIRGVFGWSKSETMRSWSNLNPSEVIEGTQVHTCLLMKPFCN